MKNTISILFLLMMFLFLLLFPSNALSASKSGLLLWFDTLLPTLLPFLIISQLVLKTDLIRIIKKIFAPFFQRLFHCSENGAFCILCGFLCGYPVGARLIALQIKEQTLSKKEGQYLLSFCNNVSPMFCISVGIIGTIQSTKIFPYLFFIYGSALLFGLFTRPKLAPALQSSRKKQTSPSEPLFQMIDVCIIDSFLIMIKLCGYLILFSILNTAIAMILPKDNRLIFSAVTAFLEITNGLFQIRTIPQDFLRSVLSTAALTFGGLCCIFQTNSVIADTGLSLKRYLLHKALTTLLALFLLFLWFLLAFAINGRS